jgi:simple sugar transport system substrate-binding protein
MAKVYIATSRQSVRVFALVLMLAAVGVFAVACGGTTTTTTAAPTTTITAAPATTTTAQPATTTSTAAAEYKFGMLLVGPYNDQGWSQANYEGGQYVEQKVPGTKMLYIDKVNSADRPGTTPDQIAESLLDQGCKMIFFTSDDLKDGALTFAQKHPDIPIIHCSGDYSWKDGKDYKNLPNFVNVMGRMEYAKMMAGVAAALTTQTGQIGYLGPLINDETRRLAASAYLGAQYAWTKYLNKKASDLKFKVNWIGFWFNIPGVTSDPTQVCNDFFNQGYDVVISGIDTTEAVTEAAKAAAAGKKVWAVAYDYKDALAGAPDPTVALGVPYSNWGPSFMEQVKAAQAGTFKSDWLWLPPDWKDINNPDTSAIGFVKGQGLSADASAKLDAFIAELGGGLDLWTGPLNLQDGTAYLKDGEKATDQQIWYLPQLLQGMEGQSVPSS